MAMPIGKLTVTSSNWTKNLPEAFNLYRADRVLDEVECIISDTAGMSRGKAMPHNKFSPDQTVYLPISLFYQTISGEYVDMDIENQWMEKDIVLRPDMNTACAVPWAQDCTMQVINDLETRDGAPLDISPRQVLKRVLKLYADKGWKPIVAPEIEFYLIKQNTDPTKDIEASEGRTGRKGCEATSLFNGGC